MKPTHFTLIFNWTRLPSRISLFLHFSNVFGINNINYVFIWYHCIYATSKAGKYLESPFLLLKITKISLQIFSCKKHRKGLILCEFSQFMFIYVSFLSYLSLKHHFFCYLISIKNTVYFIYISVVLAKQNVLNCVKTLMCCRDCGIAVVDLACDMFSEWFTSMSLPWTPVMLHALPVNGNGRMNKQTP